ncbi:AMP-binding protein [Streptomyces sp. MN03-5084-2B]|nr:AMP-binding protein [Streptomyces sp. MN03-5084-2B]
MLEMIEEHRVTIMPGVPCIYELLADVGEDRPADVSSVRLFLSGGDFLPAATAARFQRRCGKPIRQTTAAPRRAASPGTAAIRGTRSPDPSGTARRRGSARARLPVSCSFLKLLDAVVRVDGVVRHGGEAGWCAGSGPG